MTAVPLDPAFSLEDCDSGPHDGTGYLELGAQFVIGWKTSPGEVPPRLDAVFQDDCKLVVERDMAAST